MKNVYQCNVKSNLMIKTAQETIINSTKGSHIEDHTNNDVKAFVIQNYTVNYFPARIETFLITLVDYAKNLSIYSSDEMDLSYKEELNEIKKSLRFLEQKIDRISGGGIMWTSTKLGICITSAAVYSLIIGLSMIFFYRTYV